MTEIQTLIKTFGSYRKLARVMGVTATALTNMQNNGKTHVPAKYNAVIIAFATANMPEEKQRIIDSCLEHKCPTCGRDY